MNPINTATAPHYTWGEICDGWRLVQSPGLSVIEERMPPAATEQRHLHRYARQFFYVLSGVLTLEADGVEHTIAASTGLEITPGTPHQAINRSPSHVRFLVISAPPAQGDRIPA